MANDCLSTPKTQLRELLGTRKYRHYNYSTDGKDKAIETLFSQAIFTRGRSIMPSEIHSVARDYL
jgi:hypothetical protein